MEGLKFRLCVLAAITVLSAFFVHTVGASRGTTRNEKWMERNAPPQIDGYTFLPSAENPEQSYKMDKMSYEELKPIGIVSRIYQKDGQRFDVVLIAGESDYSFHDPRVCFTAQGWTLESQNESAIQTKTRGTVPVTMVRMNSSDEKNKLACYFYRGPNGFHASPFQLKFDMFKAKMLGTDDTEGVFYRFIPLTHVSEDDLKKFVADYMDAAKQTSGGYF